MFCLPQAGVLLVVGWGEGGVERPWQLLAFSRTEVGLKMVGEMNGMFFQRM